MSRWNQGAKARSDNLRADSEKARVLANEIYTAINRREKALPANLTLSLEELRIRKYCEGVPGRLTDRYGNLLTSSIKLAMQTLEGIKSTLYGIDMNYFRNPQQDFKKP